ncbi:MAG: hypothetical protein LBT71_05305 [Azoarcus sp.]|nr:hypothetical protein [Azoarcus sp.]
MKTRALLLLPFVMACPAPALAAPSTPPAAPSPRQPAAAAFIGRAFFTAAERRTLEAKTNAPEPPAPPPPAPLLPPRRFDGALWREGRIVALWFDGDTVKPASEPAIRLINRLPGAIHGTHPTSLLPGQTWPPQDDARQP